MTTTSQSSKLAELRAKTDREFLGIIDNALQVGLLNAATNTHVASAGPLHARAEETYADTVMLVSKVEDLGERWRLESKLKQLRENLEQRRVVAVGCCV